MREKDKMSLPVIECDQKTIAWLTRLPIERINKNNLEWRQFLIAYNLLNRTILVVVEFDVMTAKIKVYYNLKNGKYQIPKGNPACEAEIKFVLDRVCIDKMRGKTTPDMFETIQNRIVPILRFLLSSDKFEVNLKKKKSDGKRNLVSQDVYQFVRTINVFDETFEFLEDMNLKTDRELLQHGVVVTISTEVNKWLEQFCDNIREIEEKEIKPKVSIFDSSKDKNSVNKVSAIRIYEKSNYCQLQLRTINNVVEIAYFEKGTNCQMLLYSDIASGMKTVEVFYGSHESDYIENAKKIISVLQNVLVYLRVWDLDVAEKEDTTWRLCEVNPLPQL